MGTKAAPIGTKFDGKMEKDTKISINTPEMTKKVTFSSPSVENAFWPPKEKKRGLEQQTKAAEETRFLSLFSY
jgi:hypothetical protein